MRFATVLGCLLGCLLLVGLAGATATDLGQKNGWLEDYHAGLRKAESEKKLLVLYFYNREVRPCRELEETTFSDPEIAKRLGEAIVVAINEKESRQLAREHKLFKVPTVIFLNSSAREIDRVIGFKTPGELRLYLDRIRDLKPAEKNAASPAPFKGSVMDLTAPGSERMPFKLVYSDPAATKVTAVGDFNDWRLDANPMTRSASGDWSLTLYLREGVYEYMFYVDDKDYRPDPTNLLKKVNPYGGTNSILLAGKPKTSPIIEGRKVTFLLYRPDANAIAMSGSFNGWKTVSLFRKKDDPATWGIQFLLPPGEYSYKYIINEQWVPDPENYSMVQDENGNWNSSFRIQ